MNLSEANSPSIWWKSVTTDQGSLKELKGRTVAGEAASNTVPCCSILLGSLRM
jgi:hypothetical protein